MVCQCVISGPTGEQPQWDEWLTLHILFPTIGQLVASALLKFVAGPIYWKVYSQQYSEFRVWVETYIGTHDQKEVPRSHYMLLICLTQVASSILIMSAWVVTVYNQCLTHNAQTALFIGAIIDFANWVVHQLQGSFTMAAAWQAHSIIDMFTIVPSIYLNFDLGKEMCATNWLSLHFLRSYSLLYNYVRMRATGQFAHVGVFLQMTVLAFLRIFVLVFIMAGTIYELELLGDPKHFSDSYVVLPSGDEISFFQMMYWIVVSVTTVGYGDFAPRSLLSRAVTCIFIIAGVAYVFWVQFQFQDAYLKNREGSGAYKHYAKGIDHVVVVLTSTGPACQHASMLSGFLSEILHPAHEPWPNVVIFSSSSWEEDTWEGRGKKGKTFREFLTERFPRSLERHTWFIVGDPLTRKDCRRAAMREARMTFFMADANTHTADQDDERNIFVAAAVRSFYPDLSFRLMLLKPQSKELALQAGIENSRCFALREIKAHLLAQNVRCHGLLPMVTGMLRTTNSSDEEAAVKSLGLGHGVPHTARSSVDGSKVETTPSRSSTFTKWVRSSISNNSVVVDGDGAPWIVQYVHGLQRNVYGFELADEFNGMPFGKLASDIFDITGAILFGVLQQGRIILCPQLKQGGNCIYSHTVCFAIASSPDALRKVRNPNVDPDHWRVELSESRRAERNRTLAQGPHLSAAAMLATQLRPVALQHGRRQSRRKASPRPSKLRGFVDENSDSGSEKMEAAGARQSVATTTMGPMSSVFGYGNSDSQDNRGSKEYEDQNQFANAKLYGRASNLDPSMIEEKMTLVREIRANSNPGQEPVLLIVCHGEVWQQVRTFVGALRARYLPSFRPLFIMTPTEMPRNLLKGVDDDVIAMTGSCTKAQQLFEAGMLEAAAVVVMTGETPKLSAAEASLFRDSRVALCSQVIECWCGISEHEIFTTYELQDSNSLQHLPPVMTKSAISVTELLLRRGLGDELEDVQEENSENLWKRERTQSAKFARQADEIRRAAMEKPNSVLFDPRFAAGQIFTPELWGTMMGRIYYMPAIIELLEALIVPHRRGQEAYPWQIAVPEPFVGRAFGDFMSALTSGAWLDYVHIPGHTYVSQQETPLDEGASGTPSVSSDAHNAMQKRASRNSRTSRQSYATGSSASGDRLRGDYDVGPAVALALHRKRVEISTLISETGTPAQGTGSFNYVVLAPSSNVTLLDDDLVIVLGSRRFGKSAQRVGLLRGGDAAPPHPQPSPEPASTAFHVGSPTVAVAAPASASVPPLPIGELTTLRVAKDIPGTKGLEYARQYQTTIL